MTFDTFSSVNLHLKVLAERSAVESAQICDSFVATAGAILASIPDLPVAIDRFIDAIAVLGNISPTGAQQPSMPDGALEQMLGDEGIQPMTKAAAQLLSSRPLVSDCILDLPAPKAVAWLNGLSGLVDMAYGSICTPSSKSPDSWCWPLLEQTRSLVSNSNLASDVISSALQLMCKLILQLSPPAIHPAVHPAIQPGQQTITHPQASPDQRYFSLAEDLLTAIRIPPDSVFSQLGGAPQAPEEDVLLSVSERFKAAAASALTALSRLVLLFSIYDDASNVDISTRGADVSPAVGVIGERSKAEAEGKPQSCTIEEIVAEEECEASHRLRLFERSHRLLLRLIMLSATYSWDLDLRPSPWTSHEGDKGTSGDKGPSAAAATLLWTIAEVHRPVHCTKGRGRAQAKANSSSTSPLPPEDTDKVSGSEALLSQEERTLQRLLSDVLPELLPSLRRALVASQPRFDVGSPANAAGREASAPTSQLSDLIHIPGSTYERAVLARALSRVIRSLRHPFIGKLVPILLPCILAIIDDPSAAVARSGVSALQHLATQGLQADLLWQRDLLLDVCYKLVIGCSEELWEAVVPATIATVSALEGRDARSSGYHTLATELLSEAGRNIHKKVRRIPFLQCFGALVQCMGLSTLRHMARLMPLVLESLHAYDASSRAAASGLLLTVVRCTHQRISAHAGFLWGHLISAFCRDLPEARDIRVKRDTCSSDSENGVQGSPQQQRVVVAHNEKEESDWLSDFLEAAAETQQHAVATGALLSSTDGATHQLAVPSLSPLGANFSDGPEVAVIRNILLTCQVLVASTAAWAGSFWESVPPSDSLKENLDSFLLQRYVSRLGVSKD